ncbi:MAG: M28 family peptidase [bacterium]|nr:M28 family peptidase [bacterium]
MKTLRNIVITSLILVISGIATAAADDIVMVTIGNRYQAEVLKSIVPTALTRVENQFVLSMDKTAQSLLDRSHLEYRTLLTEVAAEDVSLILKRSPYESAVDVSQLGVVVELGHGKSLGAFPANSARSLQIDQDYFVQELSEQETRISFMAPPALSLLSAISDFPTDSLADRVSQDSLFSYDERLMNFQTRYIYTDSIDAARDWLVSKFVEFGYTDVSTPSFYFNGWQYNVMAVKQGYAEPDKVIVIGGHYDSITYGQLTSPYDYAPGADDDGSGTSLTLEMARILSDYPCRKTIIFMAFSAEEVGLVGSGAAANEFASNGTDIEVMFNYDMVAYTGDNPNWNLSVSSGAVTAYRDMTFDATNRVSSAVPVITGMGTSSDHASFHNAGFNVVDNIETEFNYPGWHTNLDLTSEMNFPFFKEVARGAAASLAIAANSAHPTFIDRISDLGDGQSLEVFWTDCTAGYDYVLYYGTSSGSYTDSVIIPPGLCSYSLTGLTLGVPYYVSVVGSVADGYPALYAVEDSLTPLVFPRAPLSLSASPFSSAISLEWADNVEGDLAGYRIYRSVEGLSYQLLRDNYPYSSHIDSSGISGQTEYFYKITAVDLDGYESDFSAEVSSYAATFDGGILLVDETSQTSPMPPQEDQEELFDTLFGMTPYAVARVENPGEGVSRSTLGQYSSVIWVDDDLSPKLIADSEDSLIWYMYDATNVLICGFGTVKNWAPVNISPGHILYDDFGLTGHEYSAAMDFAGANGLLGWPNLEVDTTNLFKYLPNVSKFSYRAGAVAIYSFDSFSDNPIYEGYPCGVLFETVGGQKRIILSFPLQFLTEASARALITKVKQEFGESAIIETNGDVNGSGMVDISDLVYLVDFMFAFGPPPVSVNGADVDGSCAIDVSDITYFVEYLFLAGPPPMTGCVE